MVLGLDISTAIIGITLLNNNSEIILIDHVVLNKVDSQEYCRKALKFKSYIQENIKPNEKIHVFIEEAGKKFKMGTSSADTIFTLARFNGIISFICFEIFGMQPIELEVKESRKGLGIVIPKFTKGVKYADKRKEIKKTIIEYCLSKYSIEELGFEKTRNGGWNDWSGDRADSLVIALSGIDHLKKKGIL